MIYEHGSIHPVARATLIAIAWSMYSATALQCLSSDLSPPTALVVHTAVQFAVPCALFHPFLPQPTRKAEDHFGCLALQPTETLLVTEYLEGGDLFQALACESEGKLSWYR